MARFARNSLCTVAVLCVLAMTLSSDSCAGIPAHRRRVVTGIRPNIRVERALTGQSFIVLSDIHADAKYQTTGTPSQDNCDIAVSGSPSRPYGQYGCDPPVSLLELALEELVVAAPNPAFILICGDFVVHGSPDAQTIKDAILAVGKSIRKFFPATPVVPALGNNDFFPDYEVPCTSLQYFTDILAVFQQVGFSVEPVQFSKGGYFKIEIGGFNILVLNSIIYSKKHEIPGCDQNDPLGQFAWLEAQLVSLSALSGEAIIAGHIPPGYKISDSGGNDGTREWEDDPDYATTYFDIVKQYPTAITAQLFGHLHFDTFRIFWGHKSNPPGAFSFLLTTPAISPLRGNNPGARVVMYDSPTQLTNTAIYSLNAATNSSTFALEYDAQSAYGITGLTANQFQSIWQAMDNGNTTLLSDYRLRRLVGATDTSTAGSEYDKAFICSIRWVRKEYYSDCTDG